MPILIIKMPFLSEGLNEFKVSALLASTGQRFNNNDALIEIETSKALIEIPFDVQGTFVSWLVKAGDVIAPGANLCEVEIERVYSTEEYQLFTGKLRQLFGLDDRSDLDEIYAVIRKIKSNQ